MTVAAALLLLAAASAAPEGGREHDCSEDRDLDRCAAAEQERVRTLFGLRSIEAHLEAKDEVRRAFYLDGYGRDVVAIEFIRPSGAAPELRVYLPPLAGKQRPEPLTTAVDGATWAELLRRSEHFHRALVPVPERAGTGDEIVICTHGWVYTVEASEPFGSSREPARTRQRTESACDRGLAEAFATELAKTAVPLLPACRVLDLKQYRNEQALLAACGTLRGDRLAAAEVLNAANLFRYLDGDEIEAGAIRGLFAVERSRIEWVGETNTGWDAAAFWIRKLRESGARALFVQEVNGETSSRVRVRGALHRWTDAGAGSRPEAAPVEQLWIGEGGTFRIERATVGPFGAVPEG